MLAQFKAEVAAKNREIVELRDRLQQVTAEGEATKVHDDLTQLSLMMQLT